MTGVLIRDSQRRQTEDKTQGEGDAAREAEMGVAQAQCEEFGQAPEKGKRQILPSNLQREYGPADALVCSF